MRNPEQPAETDGPEQPDGRQWTSSLPQVASEDILDIGNGRYAHFRRDAFRPRSAPRGGLPTLKPSGLERG